jgi:hypothetical protein
MQIIVAAFLQHRRRNQQSNHRMLELMRRVQTMDDQAGSPSELKQPDMYFIVDDSDLCPPSADYKARNVHDC